MKNEEINEEEQEEEYVTERKRNNIRERAKQVHNGQIE